MSRRERPSARYACSGHQATSRVAQIAFDFAQARLSRHKKRLFGMTILVETKRPPGKRRPFLSRENSSNGDVNRQNFLAKSYEPKKQGVKEFLGNKYLCFQSITE
jgi:hypothetical protein